MNPKKCKNVVAKILQYYAWINAICGFLISFVLITDSNEAAFIILPLVLVASFLIFALGEIIELLDKIARNSKEASANQSFVRYHN